MADGKLDLPDDLLSTKTFDQRRSVKDEAWGGSGDEKSAMGLLDESKVADQATSDSSIPLSPQWLYAKPIDAKTSSTGASGEMRAPNSLPHGNVTDPNLKDSWRLDGSQDKKDWRKIVPDVESNRRWREEERETGLLGRRDRRKEDRRADALPKDMSETRPLSSTDRWHDSRRDSKWTSRWGPEDKDKDSRNEKRTDVEKEDIQIDRQSFVSGNRPASERDNDSRDKWRPRHRMEAHAGGSAAYRSAPGFGPERGRMEGSNVRFAAGRGRSGNNGIAGRSPSVSVIGSVPVDKLCSSSAASTYCYPRGKLLDIYRKHKTVPSFDAIPDEMEHVSPITQVAAIEPLAFVAPDAEEEAVLWDIWKGKIGSSGVLQNSFRDKNVPSSDDITGFDATSGGQVVASVLSDETIETVENAAVHISSQDNGAEGLDTSDSLAAVSKERDALIEGKEKFMTGTTDAVIHDGLISSIFNRQNICTAGETCGLSNSVNDLKYSQSQQRADLILSKHSKLGFIEPVTLDVGGQLPDDSSSLFDFTSLQKNSSSDQLHLQGDDKAHSVDVLPPEPEDLSLFYLDPQGEIQGPYMGIDIIMWFEQGYFGTDLPVRLSDAPAGSPFQELGEIMPHLNFKAASAPGTNLTATSQLSDAVGGTLEDSLAPSVSGSDFKGSAVANDQQWVSTAASSINYYSRVPNNENKSELHYADDKNFQNSVAQDEEIVFPGRPASSCGNQFRKSASDIHSSISSPASHHSLANEFSETTMPKHQDDDKLHPFGLLMSELKDSSHLRRTQSSNLASGIGDQDQVMDSLLEREATFVNQSGFRMTADQPSFGESLSDDYRKNTHSKQNIHQGSVDAHHLLRREQTVNGFNLGEHIISQKLQNELQHHNLLSHHSSHATGLGIEEIPGYALSQSKNLSLQRSGHPRLEMEQLLELQFPQQRHLELQQQRHLELQQQRHLELQQQRHLEELQQQRQLEELKQQRRLEELQQRRQLEELQQRRHLEELQQRHLEELQQQRHLEELQQLQNIELQQQRHLELQQQQRLLQHQQQQQQQQRLNQMKLLQQEQQQQQQQQRLNQMKLLQQEQQQQFLWEQLLQHQISDPVYGRLKADTMRDNPLDQVQLRMHLLHELQQNFQKGQFDPSMEQIIQAKIGQNAHRGQSAALLDLISQAKHRNMLSSEQQLHFQRDPLQGRQVLSLRQQLGLEGERRINGPWSVDEAGQFFRNPADHHHVQSAGLNSSDFYQQHRRLSSSVEQFDPRHWNPAIQEQHQLGFFEPSSTALDRSMNLDNVNACGQGLDFPDQHLYMHSSGQLGSLSSGVSSHSRHVSNEFYASYPGMIEHHSPVNSGLLESNWIEKHIQQLNLKAEQQRKESDINMNAVNSSIWAPTTGDEENSKQAPMDHFHQNLGHKSMQSSEVDYQHLMSSSKTQETVWPVSETHSFNHPFSHLPDQEVSEISSFIEGPQNFNNGAKFKHAGNTERLIPRSSSGATMEQSFLSGIVEHPNSISKSAAESELQGLKGNRHGSKGMSWSVSEIKDNLEETENSLDCGEQPSTAHSRQSSLSTSGGNGGYDIGSDKSVGEVSNDRLPTMLPKGLENDWNKRPTITRVVSSSQDEPTAAPIVKQKSSASLPSDEGKRESVNNPAGARVSETGKKDLRFRRTSSFSDAAVSETSFIDMLKKPVHPEADPSNGAAFESSDGAPSGRGGKKKGKKGRQIDPALLGFKVSSNRIMMGEIQRLED